MTEDTPSTGTVPKSVLKTAAEIATDRDVLATHKTEAPPASQPSESTSEQTAAPEAPAIIGARKHIIPSRLAVIAEMKAENGFIKIRKYDGTDEVWPAERMGAMAQDCLQMLAHMNAADRNGNPVPANIRAQVMELCDKATKAYMEAKHQQEAAGRYDRETKAVARTVDDIKHQRGNSPEKGEWSGDHIPEDNNIKYFMTRFPYLKDIEISAVLRATHLPWQLRQKMLSMMNGKRMIEDLKLTEADLQQMMKTGKIPEAAAAKMPPAPGPAPISPAG